MRREDDVLPLGQEESTESYSVSSVIRASTIALTTVAGVYFVRSTGLFSGWFSSDSNRSVVGPILLGNEIKGDCDLGVLDYRNSPFLVGCHRMDYDPRNPSTFDTTNQNVTGEELSSYIANNLEIFGDTRRSPLFDLDNPTVLEQFSGLDVNLNSIMADMIAKEGVFTVCVVPSISVNGNMIDVCDKTGHHIVNIEDLPRNPQAPSFSLGGYIRYDTLDWTDTRGYIMRHGHDYSHVPPLESPAISTTGRISYQHDESDERDGRDRVSEVLPPLSLPVITNIEKDISDAEVFIVTHTPQGQFELEQLPGYPLFSFTKQQLDNHDVTLKIKDGGITDVNAIPTITKISGRKKPSHRLTVSNTELAHYEQRSAPGVAITSMSSAQLESGDVVLKFDEDDLAWLFSHDPIDRVYVADVVTGMRITDATRPHVLSEYYGRENCILDADLGIAYVADSHWHVDGDATNRYRLFGASSREESSSVKATGAYTHSDSIEKVEEKVDFMQP